MPKELPPRHTETTKRLVDTSSHIVMVTHGELPENVERQVTLTPKNPKEKTIVVFSLGNDGSVRTTLSNESGRTSASLGDLATLQTVLEKLTPPDQKGAPAEKPQMETPLAQQ
ncbi:MAG TPA: hypothetical protein VE090_03705 [Methylomirabilota bacterium]|nr:hypothetical protein [Methylomirabilota bacterium]